MALLEREDLVDELRIAWSGAMEGRGSLFFVGGEAGAGKTSLVNVFVRQAGEGGRVMEGACDPLATPEPLGPFFELATVLGPEVVHFLGRPETPRKLFSLIAQRLDAMPTVLVLEDIHWADEGTLDLLRFLGRRISSRRLLVLATHRSEGRNTSDPLTVLFGDLATAAGVRRMTVPPLTTAAVRQLCSGTGHDPEAVYRVTGGIPFFVVELLVSSPGSVPESVRDSVLARVARLSRDARRVLEGATVIGARIDPQLLVAIMGSGDGIDETLRAGLLENNPGTTDLKFKHELVHGALEEEMTLARRTSLHTAVLVELRRAPDMEMQLGRAAHHALASGDRTAILELVPLAARRAARLHAHREAAQHYRAALLWAPAERTGLRAELLSACAYESYLSGRLSDSLSATNEAFALWEDLGDRLKAGESLYWISRLNMFAGRRSDAEEAGRRAVAVLSRLLPGAELAMAYNNQAWLRMLACDFGAAIDWSRRALQLAARLKDAVLQLHANVTLGASLYHSHEDEGRLLLEACLEQALETDDDEAAGRSLWNLALISLWQRRYDLAESYIDSGVQVCLDRDLDYWRLFLMAARARWMLEQGRFDLAERIAEEQLSEPDAPVLRRIMELTVAARARARRGEAGASELLDEALRLTLLNPEMEPFAPVRTARAEAAWIAHDLAALGSEVEAALNVPSNRADPWVAGELALWGALAELDIEEIPERAEPYDLVARGAFREGAAYWLSRGCMHDAALMLAASHDPKSCEEGFSIADRMGAIGTASAVADTLRRLGVGRVPRGIRRSTRQNPSGLTAREMEVLGLVKAGLSNPAIGKRLYLSKKTVEHHVSSILGKLQVTTRSEAAERAVQFTASQIGDPQGSNYG